MAEPWWRSAVIYHILVRSFQDFNGDGEGDLPGLISRLDYIRDLGVQAIWLSPIYDSPWKDCGYDASDFERVHPKYGTLDDFRRLTAECERRGLRVILDWVPNHTSNQHRWFQESKSSRDNAKHDWYVWADPAEDGGPPNNWLSVFGGSAWELVPERGQYYFHAFLKEQPDLNWRTPAVRETLCTNLKYWYDLGARGFRIDAADMLLEDRLLRDNPPNPNAQPTDAPDNFVIQTYTRNRLGNHQLMHGFRAAAEQLPDCVLLGEMYLPIEKIVTYYGDAERPELHLPLNLQLLNAGWQADDLQRIIDKANALITAPRWPSWSLGNHDIQRLAERIPPAHARLAAMLLLTIRGTPTLYYGDELGMQNITVAPGSEHDPQAKAWPGHNRDVARSPMQWDASPLGGFSTHEPWLPVGNHARRNVESESHDSESLLNFYRRLLKVRREEPALHAGEYRPLARRDPLIAFERGVGERKCVVVLNLGDTEQAFDVGAGEILLSSRLDRRSGEIVAGPLKLRAGEGVCVLRR